MLLFLTIQIAMECGLLFIFTKIARNYSINFIFIHNDPRLRLL